MLLLCVTSFESIIHVSAVWLHILTGFNATMLAYGQTGSGKTYTMGSGKIIPGSDDDTLGVIPRVVEHLFNMMKVSGNH